MKKTVEKTNSGNGHGGMKSQSTSTKIDHTGTETKTVTTAYWDGTTIKEVFINGVKQWWQFVKKRAFFKQNLLFLLKKALK